MERLINLMSEPVPRGYAILYAVVIMSVASILERIIP